MRRIFFIIPSFAFLCQVSHLAEAVTLVYTNDAMGELQPCGCRSNPQGGMLRKMNLLKKIRERGDGQILQLDGGDLMFPTDTIPEPLVQQSELQARYILKSMDLASHDAIVPGEKDFALGLKTFEKLRKQTKAIFLGANITKKKGGAFLKPIAIFNRKGKGGKSLRIAVIGLVGADLKWPKELDVKSPIVIAKKFVPILRKKADMVIALTHQGYDEDVRLAQTVKGIDIIVGAHSQALLQVPPKINGTLIYQSSFKNQYVGVVPLDKPFSGLGHELVSLDGGYESPNEQTALLAEFHEALSKLNAVEVSAAAASSATIGGESLLNRFHTLPKCAECHLKQFYFWLKTDHSKAYLSLVKDNQTLNKECLGCHALALGTTSGFTNISEPASLRDEAATTLSSDDLLKRMKTLGSDISSFERIWPTVQCENCHRAGGAHPFSGVFKKDVDRTLCLKCHTTERAPEWYTKNNQPDWDKIANKRAAVTCPTGEISEEAN